MIKAHFPTASGWSSLVLVAASVPPDNTLWIDLVAPTPEEMRFVESHWRIEIPTREEMREIEISSRLYHENGDYYLTTPFLHQAEDGEISTADVTCMLTPEALVTVRFADHKPFAQLAAKQNRGMNCQAPIDLLFTLLDLAVDHIADVLEHRGSAVDELSRLVFGYSRKGGDATLDLQALLRDIGREGDGLSRVRECLVGLSRMITYLGQMHSAFSGCMDFRVRIKTLRRDAASLTDHATFLNGKVTFLLDAALGLINIEQNAVFKIFTVASISLMPPTLIAGLYGMNFQHMPELSWKFGYPLALVLMAVSGLVPSIIFRRKGWI